MANNDKPVGPRFSVFNHGNDRYGRTVHGGKHWWTQRILTIIGLPLIIVLIVIFAKAAAHGPEAMLATLAHPVVTILLGLTCFLMILHMRMGVQQIFEDYVTSPKPRYTALILNDAFCGLVALMIAYALFKFASISVLIAQIPRF